MRELQKPFHDHFSLTRPRPKYDNADHELVSNILASLDLVLNMISQAAGRVPTHFAHKQKDWTGKDITVKGEGEEQTEQNQTTHNENKT